jgi:hypothetical protein
VPQIVDYAIVTERLLGQGLVNLYHNAGAFGFAPGVTVHTLGWMGPLDPTIRDEMRPMVRQVGEPYHESLARLLTSAWQTHLPGDVWLMPKSHWHYELHFGNRELLEKLLPEIGIDASVLANRNDGSAIAFSPEESNLFESVTKQLAGGLRFSDFLIAFPGRPALCTIHHHEQLWWQTSDPTLASKLR